MAFDNPLGGIRPTAGDHPHPHAHPHPHPTTVEQAPGATIGASVVADIGGRVGAATIYTPAALSGAEIEIRRAGAAWNGQHTAVRPRRFPDGAVDAAFFGSLAEGDYELRLKGSADKRAVLNVRVVGGRVVSADWPQA